MNARADETLLADVAQLRVPPHSLEAEQSVLGGLLLDNGAWDRVGDLLAEGDFYRHEHKVVYAAMAGLINACKAADVVTVFAELQKLGKDLEVGGMAYLHSLAQYTPAAGNLRRYAEIVRERAVLRRLISTSDEIASVAFNPQGKPVDALLDEAMQKVMAISPDTSADEWVSMQDMVVQEIDLINERSEGAGSGKSVDYIPTGLRELDELLDGGIRPGQLIIVGARPSMGKSALADTIGLHVALHLDLPVGKFSMEMANQEGGQRALAAIGKVPLHAIRRPERLSNEHWGRITQGVEMLRHANFYSNDRGGLNINQLRAKARSLKRRRGLRMLIVDYLQLMSGTDPRAPRTYQLEEASRGLKALAKELSVPIIALVQVSRGVEKEQDPMPKMSDIRDCGAIEQDADIILFMHRPWVVTPDLSPEWRHYAKLALVKQRGGRTGTFDLMYIGENTRFMDWPETEPIPVNPVRVSRSSRGGDL